MQRLILHSLRRHTTLLKYSVVLLLLFSVISLWHDTSHAANTDQECELCLSSFDLDESISSKVTLFEGEIDLYPPTPLISKHFYSKFIAITGNRDPPSVI
ncbi:hypothetical protein J8L70_13850 [Pseudoalteromonas sp. MMG010]|uniref:hypothetical protein n=1 Tax=Pseudoalteromonas sp. MMG010 TaxID=2822685 RepID=UPI001B3A544D|nr:hypothetical protein [Pseudoalteromonas sp. MMG010]MBQ4834332.1 hypothetical protein [Pseudoalteromonas sp. MMG010]